MDKTKSIMKGGWHPKGKDGGKESWRGDFKGINQVAGWVGHGKSSGTGTPSNAGASRPLASLKDPSSFAPPPRRDTNTLGSPTSTASPSTSRGLPGRKASGLGTAIKPTGPSSQPEEEAASKPPPPPLPYRADTTGLRTDNLPAPPRHTEDGSETPQSTSAKPRVPPRLPPRRGTDAEDTPTSQSIATPSSPPPPYSLLNSVASKTPSSTDNDLTSSIRGLNVNKSNASPSQTPNVLPSAERSRSALGKAGISVPGLGINSETQHHQGPAPPSKPASLSNTAQGVASNISPAQAASFGRAAASSPFLRNAAASALTQNQHTPEAAPSATSDGAAFPALSTRSPPPIPPAGAQKIAASPAARSAAQGFLRGAIQSAAQNNQNAAQSGQTEAQSGVRSPPPVPMGSKPR